MVSVLNTRVKSLPARPGVYLFKDANGKIVYVGKAKSLRSRVSNYFQSTHPHDAKTQRLVGVIRDFDFIITNNELEALLLESTLIKKHKPRYNIRLKDDTGYPFLKITNEDYPRLEFARRVEADGARYFGPYSSASGVRGTLRFLRRVFPLRFCETMKKQPCMYYHIEKCPGPCRGDVSPEDYRKRVRAISMFLEGRAGEVVRGMQKEMKRSAAAKQFEKAAVLRDRLRALESVVKKQQMVIFADRKDRDIIGVAVGDRVACVELMFVRRGLLAGHDPFLLVAPPGETQAEAMGAFVKQYYGQTGSIPPEIIISHDIEDRELVEEFLCKRAGRRISLVAPIRGTKKKMAGTALENAAQRLEDESRKEHHDREQRRIMTQELTRRLGTEKLSRRIVGFDISTIQGRNTVGSAVSFLDAKPDKDNYRKYIIRGSGMDDFTSMREMAARHMRRVLDGDEEKPDLIIVDGGRGQLSAVEEGAREAGFEGPLRAIGYAKKSGVSHVSGESTPIIFSPDEPAAWLVQRVIAEAHRFAVAFHRKKRGKEMLKS
jgi:excinuclease ABC subunit C